MKRRGFTLFEVLAAITIVALLAAFLFPVFEHAKLGSRRSVTISNLHQCAVALILYADDYGGESGLPEIDAATNALSHAPTCDEDDTWRQNCSVTLPSPLIGSYAYIRGTTYFSDPEVWQNTVTQQSNPTLMLFLGFANPPIPVFTGEAPPANACAGGPCFMPSGLLRVHLDGSVSVRKNANGHLGFSWSSAFNNDADSYVRVP